MILIIDFGSQTTHLISRRIGELGVRSKIVIPEVALKEISNERPKGIILSGGPATVFEKGAPSIDKAIFSLQIPILGICYGQQLTAYLLGGKTAMSSIKEYGPVQLSIKKSPLFKNIFTPLFNVWMSH